MPSPSHLVSVVDRRLSAFIGARERGADRVSRFAEPGSIAVGTVIAAALPRLHPRERLAIVLAPLIAGLAGQALKRWFPRERPAKTRFNPQGGESFPSTHAANAAALGFALARVAHRHGAGPWGYAAAAGVTTLIMIERVRVAAHWPTDVIAGAVVGIASGGSACAALGA